MGNVVGAIFSGFAQVVGKILGHPLDFLSGKSCNSICGSTWDILCYIENFCVAHLLKLGMGQPCLTSFSYSSTCYSIWESANAFVAPFVELYGLVLLVSIRLLLHLLMFQASNKRKDLEEFAATSEEDCELGERSVTHKPEILNMGDHSLVKGGITKVCV
ncbi:UNVERIFIED_CONTAM: hypothetical protein Sradi_0896100 [Sesamum radiatum]|uniref:Uncharacterized protein n=1 Tax=Sesamum radiatum TaxID=300843 RepID=A0AAW2V3K1_SESRA